jgi:uncharacterized membrane protein
MNWERWQPNMSAFHRLAYVGLGFVLMVWGFWYADQPWAKLLFPVMGACALISGLISYCPTKAILMGIFRPK